MPAVAPSTNTPPARPRRTLLCVLDWGLGHAARCLALLDHPLLQGDEVFVASSGPAKAFLMRERPGMKVWELPPYQVRYPTRNMPLNVAMQLPRWLSVMFREWRRTQALVRELGIDMIISDSRFGCYSRGVPSVFLTHQLHPITGNRAVNALYTRWLQRFSGYWVPDDAARSLSGRLSEGRGYENVRYIGPLSRFARLPVAGQDIGVLALLSGPEPMRGRLEVMLRQTLLAVPGRHVLVRGVAGLGRGDEGQLEVRGVCGSGELRKLLPRARYIVCRAGYSTLMDLAAAAVPATVVYVPTPGQSEQEYLARTQVQSGGGSKHFAQEEVANGELKDYFLEKLGNQG